MMHYNHCCPKRSVLWSSNANVINFNRGRLTNEFKAKVRKIHGHVKPVNKQVDKKSGRTKYSGNKALKATQILTQLVDPR